MDQIDLIHGKPLLLVALLRPCSGGMVNAYTRVRCDSIIFQAEHPPDAAITTKENKQYTCSEGHVAGNSWARIKVAF